MSNAFDIPYGNAPRTNQPWNAPVNLTGQPTVQPQPNPYFAHWPQQMGQTGASSGFPWGKTLIAVGLLGAAWYLTRDAGKGKGRKAAAPAREPYQPRTEKDWWVLSYQGRASPKEMAFYSTKAEAQRHYNEIKNDPYDMPVRMVHATEDEAFNIKIPKAVLARETARARKMMEAEPDYGG